MRSVGSGLGLHHPLAALPLQFVLHVHAGARRVVAFGLEMNLGSSLFLVKTDRRDTYIHVEKSRTFGQIVENALTNSFRVLYIF